MQTIFSRNEKKYIITQAQADRLTTKLSEFMKPDKYSTYWVQNLFYDTENWDMIHTSMEKPHYKEKMRMRCYGTIDETDRVFLELKKKYAGVVYKRRIPITPADILTLPMDEILQKDDSQNSRELAYHIERTGVKEKFFLAYHRHAFSGIVDEDLRLTIDSDIYYRLDNLDFTQAITDGVALDPELYLLEIKTSFGIPLWLTSLLGELSIFPTSFSKYAACFTHFMTNKQQVIRSA